MDTDSALFAPYDDADDELEDQISGEEDVLQSDMDAFNNVANMLNSVHLKSNDVDPDNHISVKHGIKDDNSHVNSTVWKSSVQITKSCEQSRANGASNRHEIIPVDVDCANSLTTAKESTSENGVETLPDINGNPLQFQSDEHKDNCTCNGKAENSSHTYLSESDCGSSNTLNQDSESHFPSALVSSPKDANNAPFSEERGDNNYPLFTPEVIEVPNYHYTSTPCETPVKTSQRILEGSFFGLCRHRDGSEIGKQL